MGTRGRTRVELRSLGCCASALHAGTAMSSVSLEMVFPARTREAAGRVDPPHQTCLLRRRRAPARAHERGHHRSARPALCGHWTGRACHARRGNGARARRHTSGGRRTRSIVCIRQAVHHRQGVQSTHAQVRTLTRAPARSFLTGTCCWLRFRYTRPYSTDWQGHAAGTHTVPTFCDTSCYTSSTSSSRDSTATKSPPTLLIPRSLRTVGISPST
jgi:hypothetical protein